MRDLLPQKIDLTASSMKPYEGFIFLCGGPTDVTSHQPISIRDAIYRELAKDPKVEAKIRLAEHYKDWSHDSTYRDLVSFERHLAELSSVIVLSLESPGSIAELGLFSVIEEFQEKLLVFIETTHYQSQSFIKLGPVNYLEKAHGNNANCHRWLKEVNNKLVFDADAASGMQQEMAEAIFDRIKKPTKERLYHKSGWLDNALLLCDFLNLTAALTIREIRDLFKLFECEKSEVELRQTLYLLEKVGLLTMEPKGDQRFYVGIESRQFFQFHLRDSHFDLVRYRSDILKDYAKSDKRRFHAILEARKKYA
jgi:hypothetical protein